LYLINNKNYRQKRSSLWQKEAQHLVQKRNQGILTKPKNGWQSSTRCFSEKLQQNK